jgi:protein-L-isoaspartate O-methyltransferase
MPVGPDREQQLVQITRRGETFERIVLGPAAFVPLLRGLS